MYGDTHGYRAAGARLLVPALIALAFLCAGSTSADITQDEQSILSRISIQRMMSVVERLCSDEFRGRKAGSPEHYAVAEYLASQFRECGLSTPGWERFDGYKQRLTMRYALVRSKDEIKATITYDGPDGSKRTRVFDYRKYNGVGGLDLESEVVFVGYGIHDPASGYDDYAGLDVAGKIVLWLPGQPPGAKLTKTATSSHKIITAYQKGAVACLVCKSASTADDEGTNIGLSGSIADFPYVAIDKSIAADLLSRDIQSGKTGFPSDTSHLRAGVTGGKVRLSITPVCDPARETLNIIGVIPGTDTTVAGEIVMVGAHYDHIGAGPGGETFPGADDNASGVAALLETARSIRESGLMPRRTIVFVSWTGEEGGLVGSNYFTSNAPFPLKNIVSNIQLDMVGAGTPGTFVTTGAAYSEHYRHLASSGRDLGLTLNADVVVGASDHLAFVRKKVPSSLIYAAGEHPNYHSVRDTPSALDARVLESAARLTTLAVWRAANSD